MFGMRRRIMQQPFMQSPDQAPELMMPEQPAKPSGLFGGKFNSAADTVGALLRDDPGHYQQLQQMNFQRERDAQQTQLAEAQRLAEIEDYRTKQGIDQEFRAPPAPHRWESNDGSLMELGPDGKPRVAYADPTPKMNFIPDGRGGGQWVAVPTSAPNMPVATPDLPQGYSIRGGQPAGTTPFDRAFGAGL